MEEQPTGTQPPPKAARMRRAGLQAAAAVAFILLCSLFFPAVPIILGVLLLVAAALHAWSADLRPYVQLLLRVPVARASKRHARLLLAAGAGLILMLCGAVGATTRGHLRTEREQRVKAREAGEQVVIELLERARDHLATGNIVGAELALTEADEIVDAGPEKQAEVDELLERVRRSGDSRAIRDILIQLPQEEFEAFEQGASVPKALEFPEQTLTIQAVDLALAELARAQQARARR